jgi:hypothetical protein
MNEFLNRIIWVFREPRTGSSWFTHRLADTTQRTIHFFDIKECLRIKPNERLDYFKNRKQQFHDNNLILNTHYFSALNGLCNYDNPIIFRTCRKDKTEQFLSQYLLNFRHEKYINVKTDEDINNFPYIPPMIVPLNEVYGFVKFNQKLDNEWTTFTKEYTTETVYYEDLLSNYNSTIMPLYNWSMLNSNENDLTKKIPYDKTKIILNYDKIKNIMESEF